MSRQYRAFLLILALGSILALAGFAAQQTATDQKNQNLNTQEMVVCQVCGTQMAKSSNPISWDYKGKTYYFCSQDCKAAFMKNPEAYLKATPSGTAQTSKMSQATADEMVTCPVKGTVMKKSEAPVSWEYKGKTYYFCCQKCKDAFMKDPEAYINKMPSGAAQAGGMMMPGGQGGGMPNSPMMNKDVDVKIEDTKDGAVITLTGKTPDAVKLIHDHMAHMRDMRAKMMSGAAAPTKEPTKK